MKIRSLLFLSLLCSYASVAQPVWSPEVRADRENKWMQDSLQLSGEKLARAHDISLNYYRQLDRFSNNEKLQEKVMKKKDANMKPMLNKEQYQTYYRREKEQRRILRIKIPGPHRPE